jgi:O-antigen ligase
MKQSDFFTSLQHSSFADTCLRQFVAALKRWQHKGLDYSKREMFGLAAVLAVVVSASVYEPLVGLGGIIMAAGILVVGVMVRYPLLWLSAVFVGLIWWFPQKGVDSEGISGVEYALVAFYLGGLALWFAMMLVIKRKRLLRNTGDMLLVSTLLLSLATFAIAAVNEKNVFMGLREWLLFLFLLYYFPFREHITTKRQMLQMGAVFCGAMLVVGGITLQMYIKASTNILYAFEIFSSRMNSNNNMSVVVSIFGFIALLYAPKLWHKAIALLIAVFFTTITIVSFARAFIAATVLGVVVVLLVFDAKRVVRFGVYAVAVAVVFVSGVSVVFKDRANVALTVVKNRISSTTEGTKDVSIQSRLAESAAVLQLIAANPLGGNGMGADFHFHDPINNWEARVKFIHNGYLFIAFKLGLPLLLLFYGWYLWYLGKSYGLARRADEPFDRILALSVVGSLFALLLINVTSSIFETRDGFMIVPMLIAVISVVEQRLAEREQPA